MPSRCGLVVAFDRGEKGGERDLGVDDDVLAARQLDDDVRSQPPVLAVRAFLDLEMVAFDHAGGFEDPPELQLAPLAADVRRPKRPRQLAGLGLQGQLRVSQRAQLLGEDAM